MCLEVVDSRGKRRRDPDATGDLPPLYWDVIAESWRATSRSFAVWPDGFCLVWQCAGEGCWSTTPIRPTSLYESAYFQWLWLEDARRSGIIPRDADQYNAIQERLMSRFSELYSREPFYFCCCPGHR